jgi:SAM-dependent methyltransferase
MHLARDNMVERASESWRPPLLDSGTTPTARIVAAARRYLDIQAGSVWRDMAVLLPSVRGRVLDVGCGAQPYRALLNASVEYLGIDTVDAAEHFGYAMPDTRLFVPGAPWPVDDASIDVVLATETMEHVPDPVAFLKDAVRVLAPGGTVILTVPFAARWHFIPHDYWRYTPSSLALLLRKVGLQRPRVYARGNAGTVACYKAMAPILSLLFGPEPSIPRRAVRALGGLVAAPLLVPLSVVANLSLRGRGGDDTLGYTVIADAPDTR